MQRRRPFRSGQNRISDIFQNRKNPPLSGKELQPISGYKANYLDMDTGKRYWISGCKKKGDDTLYPGIVEIDEDIREEYWLQIRNRPDCVHLTSFRSEGKYSKRKPK